MERITQKQFLLTGFLEYLIRKDFAKIIKIITPGSVSDRGSQLSLVFDRDLKEVHEKLEANNVSVSHVLPDVPTSFRHFYLGKAKKIVKVCSHSRSLFNLTNFLAKNFRILILQNSRISLKTFSSRTCWDTLY